MLRGLLLCMVFQQSRRLLAEAAAQVAALCQPALDVPRCASVLG